MIGAKLVEIKDRYMPQLSKGQVPIKEMQAEILALLTVVGYLHHEQSRYLGEKGDLAGSAVWACDEGRIMTHMHMLREMVMPA